jgi:hypothetical protein
MRGTSIDSWLRAWRSYQSGCAPETRKSAPGALANSQDEVYPQQAVPGQCGPAVKLKRKICYGLETKHSPKTILERDLNPSVVCALKAKTGWVAGMAMHSRCGFEQEAAG